MLNGDVFVVIDVKFGCYTPKIDKITAFFVRTVKYIDLLKPTHIMLEQLDGNWCHFASFCSKLTNL